MIKSGLARMLGIVLALALVVGLVLLLLPGKDSKTLVAEFPRAVSLYEGSDVKILGIKVGTVDTVTPSGTHVIVKMSYDGKYKLPSDAEAVLISPSIVGDRFIQITPVYKGGGVLADDAHLGTDRTATPLELDQIYGSLNDLSVALGPQGVNKTDGKGVGALTRLLDSTARNFGGQGVKFNETLQNLGKFTKTLADNKDELFGTARELEVFVKTLADNDTTVRQFNSSLSAAADLLAGEREDLAAALRNLGTAMVKVHGFVKDNRGAAQQEHPRPEQVRQGDREAARRPGRDAQGCPHRLEQPVPRLQPAHRHTRHARQHRRGRQPAPEQPCRPRLQLPRRCRQRHRELQAGDRRPQACRGRALSGSRPAPAPCSTSTGVSAGSWR